MKATLLKYFFNYREKYDKLITLVFGLILIFSLLTLIFPILSWVVALLVCSLFPILALTIVVMQYDMFIFFEEVSKTLNSIMDKKNEEIA